MQSNDFINERDSSPSERERTILHVDMDAFFASVEALLNPELRNKPLIVGGNSERGVVASCSYEARFYGVRAAMSSMRAKQLCPNAIFLGGNYQKYEEFGNRMYSLFLEYTPLVERVSVDEAFLDVGGALRLFGNVSAEEIALAIRQDVYKTLGLTVSVGIATTKHVAKLASRFAKPKASPDGPVFGSGVFVVEKGEELNFLHALDVGQIWGVGPSTRQRLERIGIQKVSQLAHAPKSLLVSALGESSPRHLHNLAWNKDNRDVVVEHDSKSIGHEQTFAKNLYDFETIHRELLKLADAVASRVRGDEKNARTITVKVRFGSFKTITFSKTLSEAVESTHQYFDIARDLVGNIDVSAGIRLLGISASNFVDAYHQEVFDFNNERNDEAKLDEVVDLIRTKFGGNSVVAAQFLGGRRFVEGQRQWGPSQDDEI